MTGEVYKNGTKTLSFLRGMAAARKKRRRKA